MDDGEHDDYLLLKLIKLLIEYGAEQVEDDDGDLPIHYAVRSNLPKIVNFLIENYSDSITRHEALDKIGRISGMPLLYEAVSLGRKSIVSNLLKKSKSVWNFNLEYPAHPTLPPLFFMILNIGCLKTQSDFLEIFYEQEIDLTKTDKVVKNTLAHKLIINQGKSIACFDMITNWYPNIFMTKNVSGITVMHLSMLTNCNCGEILYLINKIKHCIYNNWDNNQLKAKDNNKDEYHTFYNISDYNNHGQINFVPLTSLENEEHIPKEKINEFKNYMSLYDFEGNNLIHCWAGYVNNLQTTLMDKFTLKNIFEMLLVLFINVPSTCYFQKNVHKQTPFESLDYNKFKKIYEKVQIILEKLMDESLKESKRKIVTNKLENEKDQACQGHEPSHNACLKSLEKISAINFQEWTEMIKFGRFSPTFRETKSAKNFINATNNLPDTDFELEYWRDKARGYKTEIYILNKQSALDQSKFKNLKSDYEIITNNYENLVKKSSLDESENKKLINDKDVLTKHAILDQSKYEVLNLEQG